MDTIMINRCPKCECAVLNVRGDRLVCSACGNREGLVTLPEGFDQKGLICCGEMRLPPGMALIPAR